MRAPRKLIVLAVIVAGSLAWYYHQPAHPSLPAQLAPGPRASAASGDEAARAFADRAQGRMITVQGTVGRLLPDDRDGSMHQRFVLRCASGQTLLVTHNIEIAPRLDGLQAGDTVTVYGEYVWNTQGGLMHWTHRDPGGQHAAGYIEWQGRRYQ